MFKTPIYKTGDTGPGNFDWEAFFSKEAANKIIEQMDVEKIFFKSREHLKEDRFRLAFTLNKMMIKLLKGREPENPKVLELGAATGFLTRWFIEQFGGAGVLVDRCEASYSAFTRGKDDVKRNLVYRNVDIFKLEMDDRFDVVCSFGLIEHFEDKKAVLDVHDKFAVPGGLIVILVPRDTRLTRTFLELHPELNLGYRELLTDSEFTGILTRNGLEPVRVESSSGYSYDFTGALCLKTS